MKSYLHPLQRFVAVAALLIVFGGPLRADDEPDGTTVTRIKFSDPAKPGTLNATLPWADLRVTGTDGDEIVVTSTLNEKGKAESRPDGLRRLDEEVTFALTEKDNTATLQIVGGNAWASQGAEFKITVPRRTALVLHTEAGGDLLVENVEGDNEISSMNGEVVLRDIGSSAVVNTMNGEINASFKTAPAKPVSLSSMNGAISVRLPAETKANLHLRSHNGAILTDFPDTVLKTTAENKGHGGPEAPGSDEADLETMVKEAAKMGQDAARMAAEAVQDAGLASRAPRPPRPPRPPRIPSFGGKSVIGTLNGGGVDIQLASMNGSITVRQAK